MGIHHIKITENAFCDNRSVVIIGNFDGMHLGHMALVSVANQIALKQKLKRIMVTFEPYTHEFFANLNNIPPKPRLSLLRDKFNLLSANKFVDELIVITFNATMSKMSAHDFIQEVLLKQLNTHTVVMGNDFKFGYQALGTADDIVRAGIEVISQSKVEVQHKPISSTLIREYASNQDLAQIRNFLGRNLTYTSRVVHGLKNGRKYGIPTINLYIRHNIVPAIRGIYVVRVVIEGCFYRGIASIGVNPTVSESKQYKFEVHLLDTNEDLYGKIAQVEILKFVRSEVKFDSMEALFVQINKDIQDARDYFSSYVQNNPIPISY